MDFQCFICAAFFKSVNEIIEHLRQIHSISESKVTKIPCPVSKSNKCNKQFQTFSGLRKHTIKCVEEKKVTKYKSPEKTAATDFVLDATVENNIIGELSFGFEHDFFLDEI